MGSKGRWYLWEALELAHPCTGLRPLDAPTSAPGSPSSTSPTPAATTCTNIGPTSPRSSATTLAEKKSQDKAFKEGGSVSLIDFPNVYEVPEDFKDDQLLWEGRSHHVGVVLSTRDEGRSVLVQVSEVG